MVEQKDPEIPSSDGHTKTTSACRTAIAENNLRPPRTDCLQLRTQRKGHTERGRRGRDAVWSEPTPAQQPTAGGMSQPQGSPEEQGVRAPRRAPQPGGLHWKRSSHNVWLWKPAGLVSGRGRGLWETKALLLKGSCSDSLALSPSTEAAAQKAPGSKEKEVHWLVLGHVPEAQGDSGTSSGDGHSIGHHFVFYSSSTQPVGWGGCYICHSLST